MKNWKRGAWRAWTVLSVAWILWAVDYTLRAEPLRTRAAQLDGCYQAIRLGATNGQRCIETAFELHPMGGDLIALAPVEFAVLLALTVAAPIVAWWLLRGSVAVVLWVARGFRE